MYKLSHFLASGEHGPGAIPLFGPADTAFEKVAAPVLLPDVSKYIEGLRPRSDAQYVLVNAMGAGEYYGSNSNGDHFPEAGLIHCPDDWSGNPSLDSIKAKSWAYGFPTFYLAKPYAHHRNKDASRAFGEVELATWNPRMKRVELVVRVDFDKCQKFGGVGVWDKLKLGQYPDVSMGTRVPYDTCAVCLDWERYSEALQTFLPGKHAHPGAAVLEQHKSKAIRGLAITRKDYCDHALKQMNRILPDGRKVWVYNDFPKFFDISFVFIGADKTAKVMLFVASGKGSRVKPSAEVADDLMGDEDLKKVASVQDETIKLAFLGKGAAQKRGEIKKDVVPSQFAGKAVPLLTDREKDLPKEVLDVMGGMPLEKSLSTSAALGVVLKPQEFQRIVLIQAGKRDLADELDEKNISFSRGEDRESVELDEKHLSSALARLLLPLLSMRSALAPFIERRVVVLAGTPAQEKKAASSLPSPLLRKIGAAYNSYRDQVMELVAHAQPLFGSASIPGDGEVYKLASAPVDQLYSPLSVSYIQQAYFNDLPFGDMTSRVIENTSMSQAQAGVERGTPLREHVEDSFNHESERDQS